MELASSSPSEEDLKSILRYTIGRLMLLGQKASGRKERTASLYYDRADWRPEAVVSAIL